MGLDADDLLLGPYPTWTYVEENGYYGGVDDILFCVGRERCDESGVRSTTIPEPLHMSMNGAEWDEYFLLVSGSGKRPWGNHVFVNAPVRVMLPQHWNGRVFFFVHGGWGDQNAIFAHQSHLIEAEYLVHRGWAVVTHQNSNIVPKQRNIHAADDSYWTQLAQYFIERYELGLNTFTTVESMGLTDGVPAQRSIAGVAKNLITQHFGQEPEVTIFGAMSASGRVMTDIMMGRDAYHGGGPPRRSGGNYNIPYDPSSGLVFDGFLAFAPTSPNSWGGVPAYAWFWEGYYTSEPDPQYPITAPFVMVAGEYDLSELNSGGLVFPVYAHRALQARDQNGAYIADPALSRDLNDWFRIYHIAGENHIHREVFLAGRYNGGGWYYDPEMGLNIDGIGRRLNWIESKIFEVMPDVPMGGLPGVTLGDAFEWRALCAYYQPVDEPLLTQSLFNLADYIEFGRPMPPSRMDEDYLEFATAPWVTIKGPGYSFDPRTNLNPDLDGLLEDSVNLWWDTHYLSNPAYEAYPMHVEAYQYLTDPDHGFEYEVGSLEMPNYAARLGIYVTDWQAQYLKPFTADELQNGYTYDRDGDGIPEFVFDGYQDHGAYVGLFAQQRATLISSGLYDPVLSNDQVHEAAQSPYPFP